MNKILLSGAALGLLSVLMAAYVDHSLSLMLAGKSLHRVLVAVKYHQLYAIVITVIGLVLPLQTHPKMKTWLLRSAYIFIFGILLFSFSIYISSMMGSLWLLYFTPIGGIVLMIGWSVLLCTALLNDR